MTIGITINGKNTLGISACHQLLLQGAGILVPVIVDRDGQAHRSEEPRHGIGPRSPRVPVLTRERYSRARHTEMASGGPSWPTC
jgi:hypothetical protein